MTIDPRRDRAAARPRSRALRLAAGVVLAAATVAAVACGGGSPTASGEVTTSRPAGTELVQNQSTAAGPTRPNPPGLFGVQPGPTNFDEQDAAKIGRTGIGTARTGFNWLWVQPRPGVFNWSRLDAQEAILAAHGVAAVPILSGSPSWVAADHTTPPLGSPESKEAWKTFVTQAVRRYGPNGMFWRPGLGGTDSPFHALCGCDASPAPITEWQVWNEPNLIHYYTPEPSPRQYARLLRITHTAITDADPDAKVVLAGLSDGPNRPEDIGAVTFLKRLYSIHRARRSFDVVAIHPYARRVSGVRSVIKTVRGAMKKKHDRKTPLWITEIGWGSAPPDGFGTTKGVLGQRRIVKRTMQMLLHHRKRWHLQRVYWFFWRDPPKSDDRRLPCRICYSAGLLRGNHDPKPAYRAFKRLARRGR